MNIQKGKLSYRDHDGVSREIENCVITVDDFDRHWIWSEQLKLNLVYKTVGRENALIGAIKSLLFMIQLRDERIAELQRISDLAKRFAEDAFPDSSEEI